MTATNVADRLWEQEKLRVDRRKLGMDGIKRIGRYTVPFEVFPDVVAELRLVVAPEGQELPPEEELAALEAEEAAANAPAAEAAPEAAATAEGEGPAEIEEIVAEAEVEPADEAVEPASSADDETPPPAA